MHTLSRASKDSWAVGYWAPNGPGLSQGHWVTIATLDSPENAAHLVSYLNGGPGNAVLAALHIADKIKFA
jgi:hypothetical protein